MVGTGLSVAVPIIFSLSGSIPRLSPSAALSMVTSIAYLGLFLGPAVIGLLTEHFDLRVGYGFILLALAMMVVLTWRLERRQQKEAKT
jgi:MFS family permease